MSEEDVDLSTDSQLENTPEGRLKHLIPHLMVAVNMAKIDMPDAQVGLAVVATRQDGSGKLTATFECEQFFQDLAAVLGVLVNANEFLDEGDKTP